MSRTKRVLLAAVATLVVAAPVSAQVELATTTISTIERGEAESMVYLEGAALEQTDQGEFLFSDGTGVVTIDVDTGIPDGAPPLFKLLGIEGTVASDGIDVSRWALLPVVTPAVIVEEAQVIEAFWGWIIAYGSQAPEPTDDQEPVPTD
jgi:hypothetical protein